MPKADSFDKIAESYFTVLSRTDFYFKDEWIEVRPVLVSPKMLREDKCVLGCGACCRSYTQDWLPSGKYPGDAFSRTVSLNSKKYEIISSIPYKNSFWCKYLNTVTGECLIYDMRPLTCEFELLRASVAEAGQNYLTTRLYGRGWALTRIDKTKGALCKIELVTPESIQNTIHRLSRLQKWMNYFELDSSRIDDILEWINGSIINTHRPLFLNP